MELVHRYLSGKLSVREEMEFQKRVRLDIELKEDLELAKNYLDFQPDHNYPSHRESPLQEFQFEHIKAERKAAVGQNIVTYGLWAALSTILMVLTCIAVIYLMRDSPE